MERRGVAAAAGLLLGVLAVALTAACGGGATPTATPSPTPTATPTSVSTLPPTVAPTATATVAPTPTRAPTPTEIAGPPLWQYVNSGWVSPRGRQPGVFAQELRVFVIASQEDLDAFDEGAAIRVSRGTQTSLGRIQFPESVLLAAYYLWRPLQGDPLSVTGFSLGGGQADVYLELEESAQGKEYPYLLAPMTMVAVERSLFTVGEPVEFVFHLNGEPQETVAAVFGEAP